MSTTRFVIVVRITIVIVGISTQFVFGGTRRHDVDDVYHTDLANDYPSVGRILVPGGPDGSGTLIASNYVLTAAHVVDVAETPWFDMEGLGGYESAYTRFPLEWNGDKFAGGDIAVVRLRNLILDVPPAALYAGNDELGQVGTIVGYGRTGTGDTGDTLPAGTKRAGCNTIDVLAGWPWSDRILLSDFDSPLLPCSTVGSAEPLDLEYLAAPGDSGGGVFVDVDAGSQLAGVVSFHYTTVLDQSSGLNSSYGEAMGSTRISAFRDWILSVTSEASSSQWDVDDGDFNSYANWIGHAVPGGPDTALFDRNAAYTVSFPSAGDVSNARLVVDDGDVTFGLSGRIYSLTATSEPSIVVGESDGKSARLTITGGELQGREVAVGQSPNSYGEVRLGADSALGAGDVSVGQEGIGLFCQTGGTNTVNNYLFLGAQPGSTGTYELSGGQLSVVCSGPYYGEHVGHYGVGTFTQTGGTNTVGIDLCVGTCPGSEGTYELSGDGQLSAKYEFVGDEGTGTFTQTGGTNTASILRVAWKSGSSGTYELSETGQLSADYEYVGYWGAGTFTQTGGTNTVSEVLHLGVSSGSSGSYTISGGSLSAGDFYVGAGTLNIADAAADITVSNRLRFGINSDFTAVPGATIHMTGSAFENESTDPEALAGLANLTLVFEGQSEHIDSFEAAGEDTPLLSATMEIR